MKPHDVDHRYCPLMNCTALAVLLHHYLLRRIHISSRVEHHLVQLPLRTILHHRPHHARSPTLVNHPLTTTCTDVPHHLRITTMIIRILIIHGGRLGVLLMLMVVYATITLVVLMMTRGVIGCMMAVILLLLTGKYCICGSPVSSLRFSCVSFLFCLGCTIKD